MDIERGLIKLISRSPEFYFNKFRKHYKKFSVEKGLNIVLFGAAEMAKIYIEQFRKNSINVIAVCDNDSSKEDKRLMGIKIIGLGTLVSKFPKTIPIVVTSIYDKEITEQLKELGFNNVWDFKYFSVFHSRQIENPHWISSINPILKNKNKILRVFNLLKDKNSRRTYYGVIKYRLYMERNLIDMVASNRNEEYFNNKIIKIGENDIYVDGGAFNGDTLLKFIEASKGKFKKAYVFEPDSKNYKKLSSSVKNLDNGIRSKIVKLALGLGERNEKLRFSNEGALGSRISEKGKFVDIVSLDSFIKEDTPTLIKMDIEGAELNALKGSVKLIRKHKPKFAICIYHKPAHLWDIPLLIKRFNSNYEFYVRHYSNSVYDTVLYAI